MGKVRDEVVNSLLRLDYTVFDYPPEPWRAWVRSSILRNVRYHVLLGLAILANSVSIGLTVDSGSDSLTVVLVSEGVFCAIFTLDLVLRLYGLGLKPYVTSHWHKFDVLLLVLQYLQIVYVSVNANSGSIVRVLSSLRMLRIFRLLRTMSLLPRFRGLWILMSAMENALMALMWVGVMVGLLVYALAIAFTLLFQQVEVQPYTDGHWKKEDYWGSILKSMFTLYQIITLDEWSNHVTRPLVFQSDIALWLRLVLLSLVLVVIWFISYGFLQVSVGVMCESAAIWGKENQMKLRMYQAEEDLKIFKILRKIFAATEMTEPAIVETLRRRSVRRLLAIVDLTHKDVTAFFAFFAKERSADLGTLATLGNLQQLQQQPLLASSSTAASAAAHAGELMTSDEFATRIPYLRGSALGREFIAVEVKVKKQVSRMTEFLNSGDRVNDTLNTVQEDLNEIYALVRAAAAKRNDVSNSPVASNSVPN